MEEPLEIDRRDLGLNAPNNLGNVAAFHGRTHPLPSQHVQNQVSCGPERDRAVLDMTFYEDRSSAEICAAMGLSLANVRVIRHRALLKLRACIDGRDGVGA